MTPKRPKARISARGPKGNSAGNAPKRARAKRGPNYPKGHPQHPEMLKAAKAVERKAEREAARKVREAAKAAEQAEKARIAALPKPETKAEAAKRVKSETIEERGHVWAEESLTANLNDSRILQLRRLYAHLSDAKEKNSLSNVVKLETLIAKIQGTLDPAPVEDPNTKPGAEDDDPFPDKSDAECEYYAEVGYWPTSAELKDYEPGQRTVN